MNNNISDIYFFSTCLIEQFLPEAGLDAIKLIEHLGVRVHYPSKQTCCGQPAYTSGFIEAARAVAAQQLSIFPENWLIVVPSGSCAGMFKHHYQNLFNNTEQLEKAKNISLRVIEFTEFLVEIMHFHKIISTNFHNENHKKTMNTKTNQDAELAVDMQKNNCEQIAVHTSCSARRELNTHLYSQQIIDALAEKNLVNEFVYQKQEECCGFGGTFSIRHPEVSTAMVSDKLTAINQSGAKKVVSADAGCLLNILKHDEHQSEIAALTGEHLASLLWRITKNSMNV